MVVDQHPSEQPRWITRGEDDDEQPTRAPLTRRRVVMAALKLVEEHGLEALTMRRVATALQVTPMSLYNHVADKAELVDLMLDFLIGDVVAACADDDGDWEAQLRSLVRRTYKMWQSHPGFVRVYTQGVTIGPNGVANIERVLRILRHAGFTNSEAAEAFFLLYRYSMASLLIAPARSAIRGQEMGHSHSAEDRATRYFSAVPAGEIPNVIATVGHLTGTDLEFGLETIFSGLRSKLEARTGADCAGVPVSQLGP